MIIEANKLYHIYNQGNDKQKVFFSRENYLFFLKKIKLHILPHTKAECIAELKGITPSFCINRFETETAKRITEGEYPQTCFNYIHSNPIKAKLVQKPEEWEFSSYRDYCGIRNGKLINRVRTSALGIQLG